MSELAPEDLAPGGCSPSVAWDFNISIENVTATAQSRAVRRSLNARQSNTLTLTLTGGVLSDQQARTAYIASNAQFQFDSPTPTDALYTAGFSACTNGSLALGGSAVWWSCMAGGFYNLYFQDQGTQCAQILINLERIDDAVASTSSELTSSTASRSSMVPITVSHTLHLVADGTTTPPTTTMSTSGTEGAPSLTGSGAATSSQSTPEKDSQGGNTLSTGASAGIGVFVTLLAVALILVATIYFRRHRRRRRHDRASTPPYARAGASFERAEGVLQLHEKDGWERPPELSRDGEIFEAAAQSKTDASSAR